ncbi:hypothetical protein [Cellulomonas terrae]|uniref:Uncharacterized protein n=1 Tax=Cellulomonas terrae TaxID=311234 RepID=A0A511JPE7_9CELL|nr:hypothetical protein [Cellulomonas terrae]GEL99413.1 hypothetical protein CTE05_29600 [Cellulomonas terrae]
MSHEQPRPSDSEDDLGTVEENLGEPKEDVDEGGYRDHPDRTTADPSIEGPVTVRATLVIPTTGEDE